MSQKHSILAIRHPAAASATSLLTMYIAIHILLWILVFGWLHLSPQE